MEIVTRKNYQDLLAYLPHIKSSLKEWKLVDIRLTGDSEKFFTIGRMADLVHSLFKEREGKIYLCNDREIFLLIRWGQSSDPLVLSRTIKARVSAISYEVILHDPTPEGLQKLEMLIRYEESGSEFTDTRYTRRENVFLVADDDMNVRVVIKKASPAQVTVQQVSDGKSLLAAYKKYIPDIMFLDTQLPGRESVDILQDVLATDPDAYVVMLYEEQNIGKAKHLLSKHGAKGIIPKPFTQGNMLEYLKKCPTLS